VPSGLNRISINIQRSESHNLFFFKAKRAGHHSPEISDDISFNNDEALLWPKRSAAKA
jgi:hypothetical protein